MTMPSSGHTGHARRWLALAGGLALAGSLTAAARPSPAPRPAATTVGPENGVSTLSRTAAWGVDFTAVYHWNGTAWSSMPIPSVPLPALKSVSMTSDTDGWAVGTFDGGGGVNDTLILHWDGTSWTQIPSPNPSSTGNDLLSVSAVSPTDAWAVGTRNVSGGGADTMILHWDGASWTQIPSPNPVAGDSLLFGVSGSSATDAWAVGTALGDTVTLHWDGTSWTQIPSPSPGSPGGLGSQLSAVSDASGTNAWAVGQYYNSSSVAQTLTLHWNGTAWTQVASPSPGTRPDPAVGNALNGVSTVSRTNAWAVGGYTTSSGQKTMLLHWDGTAWTLVASPAGGTTGVLNGTSFSSAANGWAVGGTATAARLLRWNGTTWKHV